jgi:trans-2,3-dihydro-3-hydroxyanthranilate isomerase
MQIALIDAFTGVKGQGNRAGVCLDGDALAPAERQAAAAAIGASETAFLVSEPGVDVALRYHSPSTEVPFCGHATLATFHRLAEVGRLGPGTYRLGTQEGVQDVTLGDDGAIWLTTPQYPMTESPLGEPDLLAMLRADADLLDRTLPIRHAGPKLLVPVRSRQGLAALTPDFARMTSFEPRGVIGVYVFTRDVAEPGSTLHARFFCPAHGIAEDPVTGSASGVVAGYLVAEGLLGTPGEARFEQGDAMGKPGRVAVRVGADGQIRVGGRAVTVLVGEL